MMQQERYRPLFSDGESTVGYVADLRSYDMLYMTDAAMEVFGMASHEAYCGKKCYQLLQGISRPCTFCHNSRLSDGGQCRWTQFNQKLKKWLQIDDRVVSVDGCGYHASTIREIADRQALPQQLEIDNILLQCIQTLSMTDDLNAAIDTFLEMVGRFYCADRAYIIEFDREKGILNNTFEWCAAGIESEKALLQNIPLEIVDDWVVKFRRDGEFAVSSLDGDLDPSSEDYRLLAQQGIDSLMAAPLFGDGEICGFLGVDNPTANRDNMLLLRATADFLVVELDRRRLLARLDYLSCVDTLTGVYNRGRYASTLARRHQVVPETLGVISVDINGLKQINETYGYDYGDEIIRKTADILRDNLEHEVFRISGDEFIVPCADISREAFIALLGRLRDAFAAAPDCPVSIGSSYADGEFDIDAQIQKADERKALEKQTYYHSALSDGGRAKVTPATEVIDEIAAGRFAVYYQPQIDLATGRMVGAEALVRKLSADGAIIPPDQFIPYYEARNVMMHVDLHVLDTVLGLLRQTDGGPSVQVSVNFSRSTLLIPGFTETVLGMCRQHGVPPERIVLEVTETISSIDRATLRELLREIRRAGLQLSLDDFGTKYSNTAILADIEFDEIKFDRTLVDEVCKNGRGQVIIRNMMRMCRELGNVTIVAEGIETAEQAGILRLHGCDRGQGYHFHRPMPARQFVELLRAMEPEAAD